MHSTIPIYGAQGKVIGSVRGSVFSKRIQGSKHLLRRPPAIACDNTALEQARGAGALTMRVLDTENATQYTALLAEFEVYGFPINRGAVFQRALPLSRWTVTTAERKAEQLASPVRGSA